MAEFIRKNKLVISGTFTPKAGQSGTPSAAHVHIVYTNLSGAQTSETLDMTHNADGSWSALWDSNNCKSGPVEWVAYCTGGLVASTQGSFNIKANLANTI
jgi:hypothetical protein